MNRLINMCAKKSVGMLLAGLSVVVLSTGVSMAQDFPKPGPEHAWLKQFVGEWESETELIMEPGKPPVLTKGSEVVRPLGEFWTISEVKSTMMGMPFTGNMTLGYDADKKKYVGTWIDSMTGNLWKYEGQLDPTGKILTLESEGTCPMRPGKVTKVRDVVEVKSDDHRIFTSSMLGDDGKWVTMMTSHSRRKQP